jgi:hypothetical protein
MLLASGVLASCAPDEVQQRALARYAFLYGESLLLWARRWRNQLKRDPATAVGAQAAKPAVDTLAAVVLPTLGVRHYLAAKRQPLAGWRADDIEATSLLWAVVNPNTVQLINVAAVNAYHALKKAATGTGEAIAGYVQLDAARRAAVFGALPRRDPTHWYLAADTAADLREYTLPAAQGGELGRRIAQINDVAGHLDVLLRIAPVLEDSLPHDLLVRASLVTELSALLDLTLGPPPSHPRNVMYPLVDLCRRGRATQVANDLDRLRASIGPKGWDHVRWMRNRIGAHVDKDLTMFEIHQHLIELDYPGVIRLAEVVLDFLDGLGATRLDVSLLLIGERRITSWPTDPALAKPGVPTQRYLPGALAHLFRTINSPYIAAAASTMGPAVLAGITSARTINPRNRITVTERPGPRSPSVSRPHSR